MRAFSKKSLCLLTVFSSAFSSNFIFSSPVFSMEEEKNRISVSPRKTLPRPLPLHRAQEAINNITIETAREAYNRINQNWKYAAPGDQMGTESDNWIAQWIQRKTEIGGTRQNVNFPTIILKSSLERIDIIEALENLVNKPATVECTIASTMVQILCLRAILGDFAFDRYVKAFDRHIRTSKSLPIEDFFQELVSPFITRKRGELVPGSFGYLTNIALCYKFKPGGNDLGENVFCIEADKYIGFGQYYKTNSRSLDQIESAFFTSFTRSDDVKQGEEESHKKISESLSEEQFKKMRRMNQKKDYNIYDIFDAEKVNEFLTSGKFTVYASF